MAIWSSCNIDIQWSLNSHHSFLKRTFENRSPASCRLGPTLSQTTISFELHAKMAEEIDLEKCNFLQFSEIQNPRDLDLDLGSGQSHISMHNACRPTNMSDRVTVASDSTEIWPFEIRVISTFSEVWTHIIAFLKGNSKIRHWTAVDQVPYYHHQHSVLSSKPKWWSR